MAALPCTAVLGSTENRSRVSINYKNNGPQRHRAALITNPNGKRPVHNCFKMQVNGNGIYDCGMEGARTHIKQIPYMLQVIVCFSVSIQYNVFEVKSEFFSVISIIGRPIHRFGHQLEFYKLSASVEFGSNRLQSLHQSTSQLNSLTFRENNSSKKTKNKRSLPPRFFTVILTSSIFIFLLWFGCSVQDVFYYFYSQFLIKLKIGHCQQCQFFGGVRWGDKRLILYQLFPSINYRYISIWKSTIGQPQTSVVCFKEILGWL